jgi:hypothetical protein
MKKQEQLKEQIAKWLCDRFDEDATWECQGELGKGNYRDDAELLITEVLIEDQTLPSFPEFYEDWGGDSGKLGYKQARLDLIKAGFKKVEQLKE